MKKEKIMRQVELLAALKKLRDDCENSIKDLGYSAGRRWAASAPIELIEEILGGETWHRPNKYAELAPSLGEEAEELIGAYDVTRDELQGFRFGVHSFMREIEAVRKAAQAALAE